MSEFNKYPLIREALLKDGLRDEIDDLQNEVNTLLQVIKNREKENAELKALAVTPRMIEVILDISAHGDENLTSDDIYREILSRINQELKGE